jgi:molecular chaperone DnaK (HSP70)
LWQIVEKLTGPGMSLSKDFLAEAKTKLQALDKKDAERKRTAEFKNNLEGYIYTTKEKVGKKQYTYGFFNLEDLHLFYNVNHYPLRFFNYLSKILLNIGL